jgi:isopenicillin-N N-acyltransferase like protein
MQLMDEEWAYRQRRFNTESREKCSSVAIRDEAAGVTYIGQNMDLGGYTDGLQTFIRHRPANDGPTQLVFSTAGVLALMGVNDAGVAVCVNALPQLPSRGAGMPVAFVIRLLLGAASAAEAAEILQSVTHATNQHYLIADAANLFSFEVSAREVVPYIPPVANRVFHTNHPLTAIERSGVRDETDSRVRLHYLCARLAGGSPSLLAIQDALSSHDDPNHPICRMLRGSSESCMGITTGSLLSALRADGGVHGTVSFGPPRDRGYRSWRLV